MDKKFIQGALSMLLFLLLASAGTTQNSTIVVKPMAPKSTKVINLNQLSQNPGWVVKCYVIGERVIIEKY